MRHLSDGNLDRIHLKYKINIIRKQQRFTRLGSRHGVCQNTCKKRQKGLQIINITELFIIYTLVISPSFPV